MTFSLFGYMWKTRKTQYPIQSTFAPLSEKMTDEKKKSLKAVNDCAF